MIRLLPCLPSSLRFCSVLFFVQCSVVSDECVAWILFSLVGDVVKFNVDSVVAHVGLWC